MGCGSYWRYRVNFWFTICASSGIDYDAFSLPMATAEAGIAHQFQISTSHRAWATGLDGNDSGRHAAGRQTRLNYLSRGSFRQRYLVFGDAYMHWFNDGDSANRLAAQWRWPALGNWPDLATSTLARWIRWRVAIWLYALEPTAFSMDEH